MTSLGGGTESSKLNSGVDVVVVELGLDAVVELLDVPGGAGGAGIAARSALLHAPSASTAPKITPVDRLPTSAR